MAVSRAFRIIPLTLIAGAVTPIFPPMGSVQRVMISAATTAVEIHTNDTLQEGRTLALGYERLYDLATARFRTDEVAFWLRSFVGGLVILEWF